MQQQLKDRVEMSEEADIREPSGDNDNSELLANREDIVEGKSGACC